MNTMDTIAGQATRLRRALRLLVGHVINSPARRARLKRERERALELALVEDALRGMVTAFGWGVPEDELSGQEREALHRARQALAMLAHRRPPRHINCRTITVPAREDGEAWT